MNNLKISGQPFNREVHSNQRAEKQRDESFIASSLVKNKDSQKPNAAENKERQTNTQQTVSEDRSAVLLEQRKQDMAQQQLEKTQELSKQRQIEERSATNRKKLEGSYAAVQQSDNRQQAREIQKEQNKEAQQAQNNAEDAINLVV